MYSLTIYVVYVYASCKHYMWQSTQVNVMELPVCKCLLCVWCVLSGWAPTRRCKYTTWFTTHDTPLSDEWTLCLYVRSGRSGYSVAPSRSIFVPKIYSDTVQSPQHNSSNTPNMHTCLMLPRQSIYICRKCRTNRMCVYHIYININSHNTRNIYTWQTNRRPQVR